MRRPAAGRVEAVVIGASVGAIAALTIVLVDLPADACIPILVVVHRPASAPRILGELFGNRCRMRVCEAEDKEPIEPGTIYFAPGGYHLLVESTRCIALSVDEPVNYSRPAIDVLFESAAEVYGDALVGVVLTGANSDGAAGLAAVGARGGISVVQDPATAEVPLMPQAAIAARPPNAVLTLAAIRDLLLKYARGVS